MSISGSAQIGTGGTITTYTEGSTIYVVHTFTSNGTFVPPSGVTSVEYLVVAGGGGGGGNATSGAIGGGGGGAGGGLLSNFGQSGYSVTAGNNYSVEVGAGGQAGTSSSASTNGGNSQFHNVIANGGGAGATYSFSNNGSNGGSGGGGRISGSGGTGVAGQGYSGGNGSSSGGSGGGGGAGSAGANASGTSAGLGGNGLEFNIAGTPITFSAGGKGGKYGTPFGTPIAGPDNSGNGGDGADGSSSGGLGSGANGGSGIVVIRYMYTILDYRTIQSGAWNNASIWEVYQNGNWIPASTYPGQNSYESISARVFIMPGDSVTVSNNIAVKGVYLDEEGWLLVEDGFNLNVSSELTVAEAGMIFMEEESQISGSGDFLLNAGAFFGIGSVNGINTSGSAGNLANSGQRSVSPDAIFIYNGASSQSTGNLLTTGSVLVLNNSAGLTLSQTVNLSTELIFEQGILHTSESAYLQLNSTDSSAIEGYGPQKYIDGPMVWTMTVEENYLVPVGTSDSYLPVLVTLTDGNNPVIRFIAKEANHGGSIVYAAESIRPDQYWQLSLLSGQVNSISLSFYQENSVLYDGIANSTSLSGVYQLKSGETISDYTSIITGLVSENYFVSAVKGSIETSALSASLFCAGESIQVSYTTSVSFASGTNFIAQLSDASGGFDDPIAIGTATATGSGSINAQIPGGTAVGNSYRIRVISDDPRINGSDNGTDLEITNSLADPIVSNQYICIGQSNVAVQLVANGAGGGEFYRWYDNSIGGNILKTSSNSADNTYNVTVTAFSSYWVSIITAGGCESNRMQINTGTPQPLTESQDIAGADSWIGHVYDGTNLDTYYGSYTENETFDQNYTGDVTCFPFSSGDDDLSILNTTFSVRYKMNSTKNGFYNVDIGSDDGSRLYVNGDLVYNDWNDQAYVNNTGVLFSVDGDDQLWLDFYENGGQNRLTFLNLSLVFANNLSSNLVQSFNLGQGGNSISGTTIGSLASGYTSQGYQWKYSTSPGGELTNISGATSATFTPTAGQSPFNAAGTYYLYREVRISSTLNISPNPIVISHLSNYATINVVGNELYEFRTRQSGLWSEPETWEQKFDGGFYVNTSRIPEDITAINDAPVLKGTANNTNNSATSIHTISLPSNIESGDLLVVFYADEDNSTDYTLPSGWTLLYTDTRSNHRALCIYKIAAGNEGASLSLTTSGNERSAHNAYLFAAGSFSVSNPIFSSGPETGSSTSPDPPSLTPGTDNNNRFWIAAVHEAGQTSITQPSGYSTPLLANSGGSGKDRATMATAYKIANASSEDPGSFSQSSSRNWLAATIAINNDSYSYLNSASIESGHIVQVNADQNVNDVEIKAGGTLTLDDQVDIQIYSGGDVVVRSNATVIFEAESTVYGSGNFAAQSGATLSTKNVAGFNTSGSSGSIVNSGTRTFQSGINYIFNGSSAQVCGTAPAIAEIGSLTLNNTQGLTLSGPIVMLGVLNLQSGKISSSEQNYIRINNPSANAIVGGSVSSYVIGPLYRSFLPNYSAGGEFLYPLGDANNYYPISFVNPSTASGSMSVKVEAVAGNVTGALGETLVALNNTHYWKMLPYGIYFNSQIKVKEITGDESYNAIGGCQTQSGIYSDLGGVKSGGMITSTQGSGSNRFFVIAKRKFVWTGSQNRDWFIGNNWNGNQIPSELSHILIPQTINQPQISGNSSAEVRLSSGTLSLQPNATLTLAAGPLLIFEENATITTAGNSRIILEPQSRYVNLSASKPMLEVQQLITGNKGWRNISSPVATTYLDLMDSVVTQNFTGSNFPDLQPNLLWWDETNVGTTLQGWRQPSSINDSVQAGRGHFHFVFDGAGRLNTDGNYSGSDYSDSLPIVMTALGKEPDLSSGEFSFSPLTYTVRNDDTSAQSALNDTVYYDINVADAGWNLIGNPTASTLDWDAAGAWTKSNLDNTIYIWDPAANSGNGDYLTWNGTTGSLSDGLISPYQAFWVRATTANPELSFSNDAKSETASDFVGKAFATEQSIDLPITLSAQNQEATVFISLNNESEIGQDLYDAYRLEPLADSWVSLFLNASISHAMPLVIHSMNDDFGSEIHIPLFAEVYSENKAVSGSLNLSWEIPSDWPNDLQVTLMDHDLKIAVDMINDHQYTFEKKAGTTIPAKSVKVADGAIPEKLIRTNPEILQPLKSGSVRSRFTIMMDKSNSADITYRKPEAVLLPIMPNPFTELARIQFRLPEAANVEIRIINQSGILMEIPVSETFESGLHEVEWTPAFGDKGFFLVQMISNGVVSVQKAIRL